jgi:transposase
LSKADSLTVAAIATDVPSLVEARELSDKFRNMVRKRITADLDSWIAEASTDLIASFATRVRKDKAAVSAAITQPWSKGRTQGWITKLKLVVMHGKATIDLLPARLIAPA